MRSARVPRLRFHLRLGAEVKHPDVTPPDRVEGPICMCCGKGCGLYSYGTIFSVRNVGRVACGPCSSLPHVPVFTATELVFDQIAPPPALSPRATSDWTIAHTEVIGMPANGVRIVWRCEVIAFEPHEFLTNENGKTLP